MGVGSILRWAFVSVASERRSLMGAAGGGGPSRAAFWGGNRAVSIAGVQWMSALEASRFSKCQRLVVRSSRAVVEREGSRM